nr:MAG TPA: hypothetical protein [Caudoviricetes sp.]
MGLSVRIYQVRIVHPTYRAVGCQVRAAYFRSLALGPLVVHWKHLLSNIAWQLDDECQRTLKIAQLELVPVCRIGMTCELDKCYGRIHSVSAKGYVTP